MLAVAIMAVGGSGAVGQVQNNSVSLERAIEIALNNSHDISAAEYGVRVAEQQVREAWSNVLPDVSATASYSRNLKVQKAFLPAIFIDPNANNAFKKANRTDVTTSCDVPRIRSVSSWRNRFAAPTPTKTLYSNSG